MNEKQKLEVLKWILIEYIDWYKACNEINYRMEIQYEDEKGEGMYWDLAGEIACSMQDENLQEDIFQFIKYDIFKDK